MEKQTTEVVIGLLSKLHPTLDFSKAVYKGNLVPVEVTCDSENHIEPITFMKAPKGMKKGEGCVECTKIRLSRMYSFTQEEYIQKCVDKFQDRFDLSRVEYKGSNIKVEIGCTPHGFFNILPLRFANSESEGCPKCSKEVAARSISLTTEEFVQRARERHGELYTYDKTVYVNSTTKVVVTCVAHGDFEVIPSNHHLGAKCGKCENNQIKTTEEFIADARKVHGDKYDYSGVAYSDNKTKVLIKCNTCDYVFNPRPSDHTLHESGCPNCAGTKKLTTEEFIENAIAIHGARYDYSRVDYVNNRQKVEILCKVGTHGSFFQQPIDHVYDRNGCPSCSHIVSRAQLEVEEFVITLGLEVVRNFKLDSKTEIDIFIPSLQIGIEYNGLYWHSEEKRGNNYHSIKLQECTSKGIRLIQIFEDEWISKQNLLKSKLMTILGKTSARIFARKTKVVQVSWDQTKSFMEGTHIQGAGFSTNINVGLVYEDNIVAIMTFSKLRFEKGTDTEFELIRFSSSVNVVGGFSKLLKYFLNTHTVTKIVSYSDKRWSIGNVYEKNGFIWASQSNPGYFWCKRGVRYNRVMFQKHKLSTKLKVFDPNLSEAENCVANGYYKIFDCGMDKWVMNIPPKE
jgi:hypothetical protein